MAFFSADVSAIVIFGNYELRDSFVVLWDCEVSPLKSTGQMFYVNSQVDHQK